MYQLNEEQKQILNELILDICEEEEVINNPDLDWFELDYMDSLSFVELIVDLSDAFDIVITPTEFEREEVSTLRKVENIICAKLEEKA
ncbi:MAG: phosphopantetheine-binding protein [Fastidiosipilaceae bacterium]|jgi:D-alanine--poly(phosphoribitol) ligase subunit 2|nr:D-alanine--poly(phosphoribitol) ligase subunit 2 [Clostridiaceae bacterium]